MASLLEVANIKSNVSPVKVIGEYSQHDRPSPYMNTVDYYGDYQYNDVLNLENCRFDTNIKEMDDSVEYPKSEVSFYGDRIETVEYGSYFSGEVTIEVVDKTKPASFMWDDGETIKYNPITGWE